MKVKHLFETTQDEVILQNVAKEITAAVIKAVEAENQNIAAGNPTQKWGMDTPILELGKLKNIVNSKTMGNLYNRLRTLNVVVDVHDRADQHGSHDHVLKEISLTFPYKNLNSKYAKKILFTTAVHELRHALDTSKSKGADRKNPKNDRRYTNTQGRGTKPDADKYKANFNEINARVSQTMVQVRDEIDSFRTSGQTIDQALLKSIVFKSLDDNDVTNQFKTDMPLAKDGQMFGRSVRGMEIANPLDNKQFRRIFNRVMDFAQQYINKGNY